MKKEFNITSGEFVVKERSLVSLVVDLLSKYRRVSVSWYPKNDTEHPYKVTYSQPIKVQEGKRC